LKIKLFQIFYIKRFTHYII